MIGSYNNTGGSSSIAANRISYCFDLRGPSVAIDTACSSSLVALHLACESLRRGESKMALCGGVNALILPDFYVAFSQLGVLSPDGRCKTFDARANGYVRSEGAGMVLLKPLADAIRDNDPIYCVIRGTATNQDGHTQGLTVPNGDAQQKLVRTACQLAGVQPSEIQYVETHGTGTPVGDPIEANALGSVLGESRDPDSPCLIGSVKTNIGHLEAGAGIASLIKVALSLHHGKIPAHLHFQNPNPEIDFESLKLRVPESTEPWPEVKGPRLAGINGFGYGGANAHVILQQAPSQLVVPTTSSPVAASNSSSQSNRSSASKDCSEDQIFVLPISAQSHSALAESAAHTADWLNENASHRSPLSMQDIAASAAHRSNHFDCRGAVSGGSFDDWVTQLHTVHAKAKDSASQIKTRSGSAARANLESGVLFVCCGQGAQWWGMGRGFYESNAAYRDVIDRCDRIFSESVDWSLVSELHRDQSETRLHETSIAQPALFALQVALAAAWAEIGVRPSAVVGHSVGEIAAAHLSGALSFGDACLVAIERGRTMDLASSSGAMIAAGISAEQAMSRIRDLGIEVSLAAVNGPSSVTISGRVDEVGKLARSLEQDGVFCKRLAVEYAFHSQQMDPVRDELLRALASIDPRPTEIDFISTVSGSPMPGQELGGDYWWQNVREGVQFSDAMKVASERGFEVLVELGPHPVLSYAIDECFHEVGKSVHVVPSMRREATDQRRFAESIASLYNIGVDLDWDRLYRSSSHFARLPGYPFQRQSLWMESRESRQTRLAPSHPLLGTPTDQAEAAWQSRIDLQLQSSLRDHCVRDNCVLPAAAMIETALEAARQIKQSDHISLRRVQFFQACMLTEDSAIQLETSYRSDRRQIGLSIRDADDGDWSSLSSADVLEEAAPLPPLASSLDDVRSRCTTTVDSDRCYDYCEQLGLQYGDSFRGIVHSWRRHGEALAEVHLQATDETDGYRNGIHPALLDSCFHTMIVADPNFDHIVDGLFLPREIGRIEWFRPAGDRVVVHARVIEKTRHRFVADLDIFDTDGNPCLQIRDFVSQRVSRGDSEESIRDWLYCYRWVESKIEDEGVVAIDKEAGRVWCLLADQSSVSSRLAATLRDRGDRVVRIDHGDRFERLSHDHFVIDPELREHYDQLLDTALSHAGQPVSETVNPIHWVYLWSLDTPSVNDLDTASLERSTVLTTLAPLHLIQAWDGWNETRSARLTIATRGAQSLDDEIEPIAVAQTPLIGFGRVIVSEYGSLQTKLIDFPSLDRNHEKSSDDARLVQNLIDELTRGSADTEDELMYRNGQRFAHRFVPQFDQPLPSDVRTKRQSRLAIGNAYGIDDLRYRTTEVSDLKDDEVEIAVAATGLNFSDVMKVLHLYPGIEPGEVNLGAECSGTISRVGQGVRQWAVGDDVVAIAPGSFATHTVVKQTLIARKPSNLSHTEAASIPIAFLTASHALEDCARIRRGETVLIHSASGGVGLAAMQIARAAGVTVYATAGNEEKRGFVREHGAELVMDSRTLTFADEVVAATSGRGVDVILNSLPGEAIARGMAAMNIGGRFLEIGKRDIYEDGSLGMYPLRNNLAFFAIDLDQLFKSQPERMGAMLRDLVDKFERNELSPLPTRSWKADETDAAFRFMQQAKHIGKVAIEYSPPPSTVFCGNYGDVTFRGDSSYWVVGGLGGFGLQIAKWLAERGAGTLILSGRSHNVSPEAEAELAGLREQGVHVHLIPTDATDPVAVEKTLNQIDADLPPLRGVIHSAMVLEDRLLVDLDRDTLDRVLRPKMLGGWNLHTATVDRELDHFILFSSLSSVFGHAGQANYSAANAMLDGLAHLRRSRGLPGTVINWGHLGEVGYLAQREELGDRLKRQGVLSFTVKQATDCLEYALQSSVVQMSVLRMDWSLWRGLGITGEVSPRFAHLIDHRSSDDQRIASVDEIHDASPDRRLEIVDGMLRTKVGSLLGFGESQLDPNRSLLELGLDSLMAVELRNWIESQIKITLPISQLMRDAGLSDLVHGVCDLVAEGSPETQAAEAQASQPRATPMAAQAERTGERLSATKRGARIDSSDAKGLLDALPELPSDKVSLLLAQMLREQESAADDPS